MTEQHLWQPRKLWSHVSLSVFSLFQFLYFTHPVFLITLYPVCTPPRLPLHFCVPTKRWASLPRFHNLIKKIPSCVRRDPCLLNRKQCQPFCPGMRGREGGEERKKKVDRWRVLCGSTEGFWIVGFLHNNPHSVRERGFDVVGTNTHTQSNMDIGKWI